MLYEKRMSKWSLFLGVERAAVEQIPQSQTAKRNIPVCRSPLQDLPGSSPFRPVKTRLPRPLSAFLRAQI
jgi:hypothetical protein